MLNFLGTGRTRRCLTSTVEIRPDEDECPYVDSCAQTEETPPKESLTEEAALQEFLHELRAGRNARLARDGMIAGSIAGLLTIAIAFGTSVDRLPASSALADDASPVMAEDPPARAPATATAAPPPAVDGALRTEDVTKAVASEKGEIERCFEQHQGDSPPGTVTIAFLVGERGSVLGVANVGSASSDGSVVRCVAQTMKTLTLPAPSDGGRAVVRYAFDPPR